MNINPFEELEREWFEGLIKGYFGDEKEQTTPTSWLKQQTEEEREHLKDCVDTKSVSQNNSFHYAALLGYPDLIELLFNLAADPLICNKLGSTPLHLACVAGNTECITPLVTWSIEFAKTNSIGNTPLHCAVLSGKLKCVQTLVTAFENKFEQYHLRSQLKVANLASYTPGLYASSHEDITDWFKDKCNSD